ncbi:MAG: hypothetical protein IH934_02630 [Nanoarchaeota archaeon]|nr:hypothetical protein [Nanoarchaeota archaeon]
MNNVNSFIVDWSIRFLENKDSVKGEIVNIEKYKEGFDFIINYKDKTKYFIVSLTLEGDIINRIKNDSYYGIFTLNNSTNIRFIVSNWKQLVEFRFLNIYFVNPFSDSDKVWVICPYIHDKICDRTSLESGLKSMAEMVNPLGLEELNNKIKLLR